MSTTTTPTLAFFGATGGCALATLTRALLSPDSYHIRALARTPQKLTDLLLARNIPQATLDERLTIIQGNVKDEAAVRETLTVPGAAPVRIVDKVVSGIGAAPVMRFHPVPFTLDDPSICATATATIIAALSSLQSSQSAAGVTPQKPLITVVSTTGISTRARDVPFLFWGLYHWLLVEPHKDKRQMERVLSTSGQRFVAVRASLLMDGEVKPLEKVRQGWEAPEGREGEKGPGPAVGYTISRESVGAWIFERCIKDRGEEWEGRMVSVTE